MSKSLRTFRSSGVLAVAIALISAPSAIAGTMKTITLDGLFDDWADVPVITDPLDASDPLNATAEIDYASVQIANDADFLYIRYTFHEQVDPNFTSSGIFIAVDSDNDAGTGFNVYSLGLVGAEASWQNDFPFTQAAGNFNTGDGVTDGQMLMSPYNQATTSQEISIDLDAVSNATDLPIFPSSFTLLFFKDHAPNDLVGPVSYTLATAPLPEPAAALALGMTAFTLLGRRRATRNHAN